MNQQRQLIARQGPWKSVGTPPPPPASVRTTDLSVCTHTYSAHLANGVGNTTTRTEILNRRSIQSALQLRANYRGTRVTLFITRKCNLKTLNCLQTNFLWEKYFAEKCVDIEHENCENIISPREHNICENIRNRIQDRKKL